jgi:hypothetical protein
MARQYRWLAAVAVSVAQTTSACGQTTPTIAASCFARGYSTQHLSSHPAQRVDWIGLEETGLTEGGADVLSLRVRLRNSAEVYEGQAYCRLGGDGALCTMEGDAGGFTLSPRADGRILMSVDPSGLFLEGARDITELSGTRGDDRAFLLSARENGRCRPEG